MCICSQIRKFFESYLSYLKQVILRKYLKNTNFFFLMRLKCCQIDFHIMSMQSFLQEMKNTAI